MQLMDDLQFKKLLVNLPTLSPEQIKTLTDRLRLLGSGPLATVVSLSPESWILNGIRVALDKRGLGKTLPKGPYVRKLKAYKQGFEKKAAIVEQTLEEAIPDMTKLEKKMLGVMGANLLAANIETWAVVSADLMLRRVDRIPECLELAFPGYIASGLLRMILRDRRESFQK